MVNDPARNALFYKLVTAFVFLALAVVSAIVLLTAAGVISPSSFEGGFSFLRWPLEQISRLVWPRRIAVVGLAVISGMLFITLVLKQFSNTDRSGWHVLNSDDRGFIVLDTRGIASIAEQAALSAHGVIEANVLVRGRHSSPVRLRVDIGIYPGANVKQSAFEARGAVIETVETMVGIDVQDVVVKAHVVSPDVLIRGLG